MMVAASDRIDVLSPDWPAPVGVKAAFSFRGGGVSTPPFDSLNLGAHVGDRPDAVNENRRRLNAHLALPQQPLWVEQVHGISVLSLDDALPQSAPRSADGVSTRQKGRVCAVQVADCLPVLFCATDGTAVAAAHAGWRGLAAGVLEATVATLGGNPGRILAWLGPAIGPAHFEVGDDVRGAFLSHDPDCSPAFTPNARGRFQCDLFALARRRLLALGVCGIYGGSWCTFAEVGRFFSYRRDGRCGRMAALIWMV
jgi:polyphenol oxidase